MKEVSREMKIQYSSLPISLVMLILALFIVGCQSFDTGGAMLTPLSASTPLAVTNTLTREPTPIAATPTLTPFYTLTPSLTPSPAPTKTPRPTWTPKPTPLPTLPPDQAKAFAWELYQNNAGCQLPCWWGFTPGQTYWKTAEHFLAAFASRITILGSVADPVYTAEVTIRVPEEIYASTLRQFYIVENKIILEMEIETESAAAYKLPDFLIVYGEPSEVWLRTYSKSRERSLPFEVIIFYSQRGIVALFDVINAEEAGDQIHGCPQEAVSITLGLWSPERRLTFAEALDGRTNDWSFTDWPLRPLEEATSMSVETFYETFADPDNTTCLDTPADLWPSP